MENKSKLRKMIYGIGINDHPNSIYINGKLIPSYVAWYAMFQRCYSEKFHENCPTYIGCSVHPDWIHFSNFKKWFDINYREGYQLDKDILVQGNKVYSPNTCNYIPGYINSLVLTHEGKLLPGVRYLNKGNRTKPYRACCKIYGKDKLSGYFATELEAHQRYIELKTQHVRQVAYEAFIKSEISIDVYHALTYYYRVLTV